MCDTAVVTITVTPVNDKPVAMDDIASTTEDTPVTVIAKGKLFKSFLNEFSTIFPQTKLPENEYFMLELYDFENNLTNNSG